MPTVKNRRFKSIYIILIISLVLSCIPGSAFAVMKEVGSPSSVTTFNSSEAMTNDYCKATVKGKTMTIQLRTMIPTYEFRLALYGVVPKTGYTDLDIYIPAEYIEHTSSGNAVYGFKYTLNFENKDIADGQYFLYISRIETPQDTYETAPNSGGLYKNLVFKLTKDTPKILKYNDVITENKRVRAIGEDYDPAWYLDEYLEDIRFTLKIPETTIYKDMTPSKVDFMHRMSNQITAGAYNDYDKLLKIYEYVAREFYYDSVAFSTHSYQYANPYDNLYNHVYKIPSENSDSLGRVATTCQGYSAIFLSLARAQGIPTRFVYGHRATSPINNWQTEANIGVKDHWWVESYVNGRWIFIDPTIGTNNKYNKTTGVWQYFGLNNYTYFDPSNEQIAVSHIYHNIYPDKRFGYMISDETEMDKLTAFLNAASDGKKNGTIMNSAYTPSDTTTWGDGTKSHFMTDGYGKTTQIQWSNKGFTGEIDLSGFKKLKLLSMHDNKLESADLSNCTSLENVYLYGNKLTSVNLENVKNLQLASITINNALKDATIYANGRNVYIHAASNGAFQIRYDNTQSKKLEVRYKPNIGYKVNGLYNGSGKKVSSSQTKYLMNPGSRTYELKFALDPNSYRYQLYTGRNSSTIRPYTMAAQKRLTALGYYNGEVDGIFDDELAEITKVFQHVNAVSSVNGTIDRATWSILFSTKAIKKPSDEDITKIIDIHNQSVSGDITSDKEKVVLTWELDSPQITMPTGYQVWKSTKKTSGFRKIGSTKNFKFTNKAGLKANTTYYYKVRGYKTINGNIYYTKWTQLKVTTPKAPKKTESKKSEDN